MKETLKYLRMQHNLSQNKIADYLGISRQMYIKYESGETEPAIQSVRKLSKLYKVSYEVLIDDGYKAMAVPQQKSDDHSLSVCAPVVPYTAGPVNADSFYYREILGNLFKLNTDDLIRIASKALHLAEEKKNRAKNPVKKVSQEEKEALFHKLSGSISSIKIDNWKAEKMQYLDERYGL